ncbi:PAS domain-containing sensor histidine kinase [Ktedonobacter racemifer]|uniref:histidine kinase n=1 Tax=Ktedonobacter racemifer DSM 44963 TaxID=485913 RepID=D6TU74_KTERA|nr:PAS domain S-box protein [Ktedonobacter racemifer]EFH83975.1 PAS/PAC sensor signal transduction histidine kinase [Ktedonobacter racemifer DSM 44963]
MSHTEDFNQQFSASSPPRQIPYAHLHVLLDISLDALLLLDKAGKIVMANKHTEKLFGYAEEELYGASFEFLFPSHLHEASLYEREQYFAIPQNYPKSEGLELYGQKKDGNEFPVEIDLHQLMLDDKLHALCVIHDMTDHKAAEQEQAAQALHLNLLTNLVNLAADAILIRDPVSRILFWNHGAEQLYGWSEQEVLGRITHSLLETRFPQSQAATDEALEQKGAWEGELTHTSRDGRTVVVESRQALIRDDQGKPQAILEVNRDITERRGQEQHSQGEKPGSNPLFLRILDSLSCGVFLVTGADARLLFANRSAHQVWGTQWPFLQPLIEFLRTHDITILNAQGQPYAPDEMATFRAFKKGEHVHGLQSIVSRHDGKRLPILIYAEPFELPANMGLPASERAVLLMYQDITAIKEAEYLKDEFVEIVAHELQNPLNTLASYADLLQRDIKAENIPALTPHQQKAIAAITESTSSLSSLTEDLLDVTRLQAGRLVLNLQSVNIVPLIQQVIARLQATTSRHQIEFQASSETMLAHVDPARLEQIMHNIIDNAIKYSPEGGPILMAFKEEPEQQRILGKVQDQGIGIPKQQHGRIFGRFMRADNARARQIPGIGLGLYLCHELIELMGGSISFDSEEGQGSTFYVTFPVGE